MSYIVKNCPAYDYEEEFDYHICKLPLVPYECSVDDCQKRTDCVIKQVIKIAKDIIEKDCCKNSDVKAKKILQLFDIEEINK